MAHLSSSTEKVIATKKPIPDSASHSIPVSASHSRWWGWNLPWQAC